MATLPDPDDDRADADADKPGLPAWAKFDWNNFDPANFDPKAFSKMFREPADERFIARLDEWFPDAPGSDAMIAALAPEGWAASPLRFAFHPTVDMAFEETTRLHTNLRRLGKPKDDRPETPLPTREEVAADHKEEPVRPREECADLFGLCLWDVLSDGHHAIDEAGEEIDFGSFRGTAGVIADWVDRRLGTEDRSYLDYYCGPKLIAGRCDLTPIYRYIFRRLRACECDWVYVYPQLFLIDLSHLKKDEEPYDPEKSLERERKREEVAEQQRQMDEDREAAMAEARERPPPTVVAAYEAEIGRWPRGWPPGE